MRPKLLVVDDEPLARTLVRALAERDPELEVVGESPDGRAALRDVDRLEPDLVFLDVQMPAPNGIEVAEQLAMRPQPPHVVFVTAYDRYAVRAFELHVLDYLVKPIQKVRFAECVARAKRALRSRALSSLSERLLALTKDYRSQVDTSGLTVRKGDRVTWIEPDEIVWIEAANQYVQVHTRRETFTISESLGTFLRRACASRLLRIHRSAAVNTAAIERIEDRRNGTFDVHLTSGAVVTLSRRRRELLPLLVRLARSR